MALTPEIRKLLQQTLKIRDSEVPFHRVLDILATEDGDVSKVINRFRDIREPALRRAFHQCAVLLRVMEREAGLTPTWEQDSTAPAPRTGSAPAGSRTGEGGGSGSGAGAPAAASGGAAAPGKASKASGSKFRPEDLKSFENEDMRGKVRMAKAYVDGASKGNPGQAGIGAALFTMGGEKIAQLSRAIGLATNNQAEYTALREALEMAHRMGVRSLFVFSDSELMVKQINGVYKVKNPDIQERMDEVQDLIRRLEKFSITWVPREQNALADALSTSCLKKPSKDAGAKKAGGSEDLMGEIDETADEGSTD